MNRVITIDNFLTEEECVQGIDIINTHEKEPFKDNPTGAATSIHSTYSEQVMNEHSDKLIPIIKASYQWKPSLYLREGFWTTWLPDSGAAPHSDAHGPDLYDNLYSVVIYLNDLYDKGGEIYFPNQDIEIKPHKGMAVIFPCGGYEYFHGVRTLREGIRLTLALWFWDGTYDREF